MGIFRKIIPEILITDVELFFGLMSEDKYKNTVVNSILSLTRWNIWKRRCTNKYDGKLIPIKTCLDRVMRDIDIHISILEKRPQLQDLTRLVRQEIA